MTVLVVLEAGVVAVPVVLAAEVVAVLVALVASLLALLLSPLPFLHHLKYFLLTYSCTFSCLCELPQHVLGLL